MFVGKTVFAMLSVCRIFSGILLHTAYSAKNKVNNRMPHSC